MSTQIIENQRIIREMKVFGHDVRVGMEVPGFMSGLMTTYHVYVAGIHIHPDDQLYVNPSCRAVEIMVETWIDGGR